MEHKFNYFIIEIFNLIKMFRLHGRIGIRGLNALWLVEVVPLNDQDIVQSKELVLATPMKERTVKNVDVVSDVGIIFLNSICSF